MISAEKLANLVERIERLESERTALTSDIGDLYKEAKSNGFDAKVLRKLIMERRADPADHAEEQTLLDIYRNALSGARPPSPMFGKAA